jgi:hypothetical protein
LNNSLKLLYVGARKTDGNHFKISALQKCWNVGLRAIFLIGQIVFSWILILNLVIVVDVVFKCLRQRSNGLKICVFLVSFGIIKHL